MSVALRTVAVEHVALAAVLRDQLVSFARAFAAFEAQHIDELRRFGVQWKRGHLGDPLGLLWLLRTSGTYSGDVPRRISRRSARPSRRTIRRSLRPWRRS